MNQILLRCLIISTFIASLIAAANIPPRGYAQSSSATITKLKIPIYMISTRGNENNPQGIQGPGFNNNYRFSDISQLFTSCPTEAAIFIHGWAANQDNAKEQLDRVKMSLEHNNYNISLIGFSWPSHVDWSAAKLLAKENGPKLAQFILNFKDKCADSKVRLIAHSLGSRVVLSALESLLTNQEWNNKNFKILSVHLMGAAVDDREVSMNHIDPFSNPNPWLPALFPGLCTLDSTGVKFAYGQAIKNELIKFYNMVDSEDNALGPLVYQCSEGGNKALGQSGKDLELPLPAPVNYIDIPVQNEIKPFVDADGDGKCDLQVGEECTIIIAGNNHMGYMGFRNPANTNLLKDDGAMNVVVNNWRSR
jgi:pimeloyl-ACP methyl ester carboxylesterase